MPDYSVNGYGTLFLRNLMTGDALSWGETYDPSNPVPVLAGTYDLFYELTTAGTGAGMAVIVPRNKRAQLTCTTVAP